MKIVINDSSKFEKLNVMFKVLKQFTTDIVIECNKKSLYIQAMDKSKISMAEYSIFAEWFDSYNVKKKEVFAINTKILCAILNCYISDGTMELNFDDNELQILYYTNDKNAIIKEKKFFVPLIDIQSNFVNIPEVEYEADLGMSLSLFNHVISEISTFSTDIEFNVSEEQILFTTNEQYKDMDTIDCALSINLDIDKINEFSIDEGADIKVSYSTKQIHILSLLSKIFENIMISISQENPLKLEFTDENNYNIKFYFAPKISVDE